MENQNSRQTKNYLIPLSIIIAGVLVAAAILLSGGSGGNLGSLGSNQTGRSPGSGNGAALDSMRPITGDDHIKGSISAPVKIVEYSDLECPFCKRFHPTVQQAIDEYEGQVAWVYRHFPLDVLHSKARSEAVASECAAEQGGNDAFWRFVDRFFELTPSNDQTDTALVLPQIAGEIGLDMDKFNSCLTSDRYDGHIQADVDDATVTGGRGTPWSIIVASSGKKYPFSGAQPYAALKTAIDKALEESN